MHGSYFEFRDGAPFSFPIEVEVTSVFGEVLKDDIVSLQVERDRGRDKEEGGRGGRRDAMGILAPTILILHICLLLSHLSPPTLSF